MRSIIKIQRLFLFAWATKDPLTKRQTAGEEGQSPTYSSQYSAVLSKNIDLRS